MELIGVITGDIVNSTEILNSGHRDKLLETLNRVVADINEIGFHTRLEMYRGDSFQLVCDNVYFTLSSAISLRAALIAASESDMRWDARLGIGIGEGEYIAESIAQSDGEAFRLSGKAFDKLDKNDRLALLTPFDDFNAEMLVGAAFADDIISGWTQAQASVLHVLLTSPELSQKSLAELTGRTQQTVSKLLMNAKMNLIFNLITRFQNKLGNLYK